MRRPPIDRVLVVQGAYYVLTGVAPFVSRRAFERVTGPKTEWWLVQTVGALVTGVGAALIAAGRNGRATPELVGTAAACAVGLGAVETVHVIRGRIAPTYLIDAAIELAALAGLAAGGATRRGGAERAQGTSDAGR
jgi:hypothetical protein